MHNFNSLCIILDVLSFNLYSRLLIYFHILIISLFCHLKYLCDLLPQLKNSFKLIWRGIVELLMQIKYIYTHVYL